MPIPIFGMRDDDFVVILMMARLDHNYYGDNDGDCGGDGGAEHCDVQDNFEDGDDNKALLPHQ